jgi:hypothetical protein
MPANLHQRAIALLCVVSLFLTSCYSLQPVTIPSGQTPPSLPDLKVGDTVVVTTRAGGSKKFAFEVDAIEPDALVGHDVRVPYVDMTTLGVKQLRKGATTVLIVGVVLTVLGIVAYSQASESFEDVFDGPY